VIPVGHHAEAAFSLKDWISIFGGIIVIVIVFLSGWSAFLQSKIKSITAIRASVKAFWEKWDKFQEKYSDDRLADAKEFATKSEVAKAVSAVEDKIESSEQRLEARIISLDRKIDQLLSR